MVSAFFFFFKQKTAYELRISDWSSDVCSSDLPVLAQYVEQRQQRHAEDGEDIALDAAEQLRAQPFEMITADAVQNLIAGLRQIGVEKTVAELAHGQLRCIDMAPGHAAAARQYDRRFEFICFAALRQQLSPSTPPTDGLVVLTHVDTLTD